MQRYITPSRISLAAHYMIVSHLEELTRHRARQAVLVHEEGGGRARGHLGARG